MRTLSLIGRHGPLRAWQDGGGRVVLTSLLDPAFIDSPDPRRLVKFGWVLYEPGVLVYDPEMDEAPPESSR